GGRFCSARTGRTDKERPPTRLAWLATLPTARFARGGRERVGAPMTAVAPSLSRGAFGRRLAFFEPSMALWLVLIAVLVFLVASPMVRLVVSSFQEPAPGRFTLANYVEAYGSLRHLRAVLNSLELGVGVAFLAGLFGVPIAWAISRTDMPGKGLVRLMVFGAFITPPYLGAIGWILLAGPNARLLNKLWMA